MEPIVTRIVAESNSSGPHANCTYPSRRAVMGGLGAAVLSLALPRAVADTLLPLTHSQIEQLLKPILMTEDPALWKFAVGVYEHCILGRMQPAEPPLRHPWLVPGGIYVGQWIWDTTFLTDLLAILPGEREFIRGIYANYWEFQQRWNKAKPDYAHGMIANFIAPDSGPAGFTGKDWLTFPAYSQAPLLAWGVERVYARNHDVELVRQALAPLESFHNWYWRERDLDGVGLVTVGVYDGVLQHARYETYDNEVDLDSLQLTPHPGRPAGPQNGPWYGDIYIPANTAYLLLSEASLVRLAEACGNHALAARRRAILDKGIDAMRRHMWDEEQGCFLAVHRNGLRKLTTATIGGMVPLYADIPTRAQAARMAQALATPHWNTPVPIPSVDRLDAEYKSDGFWRGDVWPSSVYQTLGGLAHYGHRKLAGEMAGRLLDNAIKAGVSEHYDSQTGAALGVPNLGMSAVLLTMALEGLSPRHAIHVAAQ
jgi:glycogen debranching enzyme